MLKQCFFISKIKVYKKQKIMKLAQSNDFITHYFQHYLISWHILNIILELTENRGLFTACTIRTLQQFLQLLID